MKVKSAADIAAKWARVAPTRQQDYEAGVKDPAVDWARAAAGSSDAYEAGINDSIQRGAYQSGITAAGNQKWARKAADVGVARWAPGVRSAQGDMETKLTKYVQVLERTSLPPRGPRGDARNIERSAIVAKVLSDARRAG